MREILTSERNNALVVYAGLNLHKLPLPPSLIRNRIYFSRIIYNTFSLFISHIHSIIRSLPLPYIQIFFIIFSSWVVFVSLRINRIKNRQTENVNAMNLHSYKKVLSLNSCILYTCICMYIYLLYVPPPLFLNLNFPSRRNTTLSAPNSEGRKADEPSRTGLSSCYLIFFFFALYTYIYVFLYIYVYVDDVYMDKFVVENKLNSWVNGKKMYNKSFDEMREIE